MTLDTIYASNKLRGAADLIAGVMNNYIAGCSKIGVGWLFETSCPTLGGQDMCENFSSLPYDIQPRVPVPRTVTTAFAAVVTTRQWEAGMRETSRADSKVRPVH